MSKEMKVRDEDRLPKTASSTANSDSWWHKAEGLRDRRIALESKVGDIFTLKSDSSTTEFDESTVILSRRDTLGFKCLTYW